MALKRIFLLSASFLLLLLLCFALPSFAYEEEAELIPNMIEGAKVIEAQGASFTDHLVLVPIPVVNPTLGTGAIGSLVYMHPDDENEATENVRQTMTGIGGMVSSSESWMTGVFHKGYYDKDRLRVEAILGYGEFKLKYYGTGTGSIFKNTPIKYDADVTVFRPEVLKRVAGDWLLGARYTLYSGLFSFDITDRFPNVPKVKGTLTTAGASIVGKWDTTNHNINPSKGGKFEGVITDFSDRWGGDFEYLKAEFNYSHYYPLSTKTTLAALGELNTSFGSTPFFDLPSLNMRGFPYGKYIDKHAAGIQGEIRHSLTKRFGVTLFGGLGWVGTKPTTLFKGPTIPAGGFGVRYMVAEDQKLNLSADIAFSANNAYLYFSAGEWY